MNAPSTQPPARVLVLIPTLDYGGAEIDLARCLPRIDRDRIKVIVNAFLSLGPLHEVLTAGGIEVIGPTSAPVITRHADGPWPRMRRVLGRLARRFPWWRGRAIALALGYWRAAVGVARRVDHHQINVIHAVLPNSYVVGGVARLLIWPRSRKPRLIMSRLSLNWYQNDRPVLRWLERAWLHRVVDHVICNSNTIRAELIAEGVHPEKITVVYNGMDHEAFARAGGERAASRRALGISPDARVITVVGNLHPLKGHQDLLRALHGIVADMPPDWHLIAPGRDVGANLAQLQALTDTLGLSPHVRFIGSSDRIAEILAAADIHVSASHTEGFPNNVLEAMGMGLPVIATGVGGVPEMVRDGVTGLLVSPHDPQALGMAIAELIANPARAHAMGQAGQHVARGVFSLTQCVAKLSRIYHQQAGGRGGSA